ncbi:hypothetical protein R3P38DRAFT_3201683 [Favolaschia claudopus]|uniref:Uncharacterized protein n=1 Tax=Favolaschia claudopus TaxID=2862362 RepID=A0AAW0AVP2_9AGAR
MAKSSSKRRALAEPTKLSKPETRQKEAAYLQQRRAATKAKRRQWDPPPKRIPRVISSEAPTGLDVEGPTVSGLDLLADLAAARIREHIRPSSSYWESLWVPRLPLSLLKMLFIQSRSSDSRESSRDAVSSASVFALDPAAISFINEPLPRYCSPTTPIQRNNWRMLGRVGPLSGVQYAQLIVVDLAEPLEFDEDAERVRWDISGRGNPRVESMSSDRWKWVRSWRHAQGDYEYNMDWDEQERDRIGEEVVDIRDWDERERDTVNRGGNGGSLDRQL